MKTLLRCLLLGAAVLIPGGVVSAGDGGQPLTVIDWAAASGPLFPHSAIIEGETEIGLVDVQQSKAEAHRLVADLLETGKPVTWVYVTHPHLDHFAGADVVRSAFPQAKFYGPSSAMDAEMARQVETRRIALGQGTPGGVGNLPEAAPKGFKTVPGDGLRVDGQRVDVLRGTGDHPDASVVWVPSARTIIAGDVIFNRTHAFFGDHDDLDGWIDLVERAVALDPVVVVAGHSKTLSPDGVIARQQLAWLRDLRDTMQTHRDPATVKRVMVEKYPDFDNAFIFDFSYDVKRAREADSK
jgi:glyoxylase-like metal-dependent hydrolase (beta-lactamase superfamily II)